jgi:hypothetical protein
MRDYNLYPQFEKPVRSREAKREQDAEAGTSAGAVKGWQTRKAGGGGAAPGPKPGEKVGPGEVWDHPDPGERRLARPPKGWIPSEKIVGGGRRYDAGTGGGAPSVIVKPRKIQKPSDRSVAQGMLQRMGGYDRPPKGWQAPVRAPQPRASKARPKSIPIDPRKHPGLVSGILQGKYGLVKIQKPKTRRVDRGRFMAPPSINPLGPGKDYPE